jgi:outer membrane cobalamin receptor
MSPKYQGSRYTSIANVGELPAVFTLDASATISLPRGIQLYAAGKNLTRSSYSLIDGYPMPEMTVTVGAKYSYR